MFLYLLLFPPLYLVSSMIGNTPASPQISSRMILLKNEGPKSLRFYATTMQCPYFMSVYYPICIFCMTIFQSCFLITVSDVLQHCHPGYGEMQSKHGLPNIGKSLTPMKIEEKSQPELHIKYLYLWFRYITVSNLVEPVQSKPVATRGRRDVRICSWGWWKEVPLGQKLSDLKKTLSR